MDTSFEEKVRERAYQIWMSAGMGDGMAHEHWLTAETAVRNETVVPALKVAKSAAAKAPTVKSAKPAAKAAATKKAPAKKTAALKH